MNGCFIDVGSTFTKVRIINVNSGELLATSHAPTTVETDVMKGLSEALEDLEEGTHTSPRECKITLASSSAAGGLRMVVVGFSPEYTLKAGTRAALGAGAKIVGDFTWYLDEDDTSELEGLNPDLILLTGGTDGGNSRALRYNADELAQTQLSCPIIVAGNADVRSEAASILEESGYDVITAENVLASGDGELNVQSAREKIREAFMSHIIDAKGIGKVRDYVDKDILPTPDAVSRGCEIVATVTGSEEDPGEVIAVDVGGATTDIHTIGAGDPTNAYVRQSEQLNEPFRKRTVEGDLGIRYNAQTILERFGADEIRNLVEKELASTDVNQYVDKISIETEWIPKTESEIRLDKALASLASEVAVKRHAGILDRDETPDDNTFAGAGEATEITSELETDKQVDGKQDRLPTKYVQIGKDLTEFRTVVGTGGVLVNNPHSISILESIERESGDSNLLLPENPRYYIDENYLLFACGLMADMYPEAAKKTVERNILSEQ